MEAGQCMEGVPEEILQQRKPVWRYTIEEEFWGKFCFDEIYFGFVDPVNKLSILDYDLCYCFVKPDR